MDSETQENDFPFWCPFCETCHYRRMSLSRYRYILSLAQTRIFGYFPCACDPCERKVNPPLTPSSN